MLAVNVVWKGMSSAITRSVWKLSLLDFGLLTHEHTVNSWRRCGSSTEEAVELRFWVMVLENYNWVPRKGWIPLLRNVCNLSHRKWSSRSLTVSGIWRVVTCRLEVLTWLYKMEFRYDLNSCLIRLWWTQIIIFRLKFKTLAISLLLWRLTLFHD